MPIMEVRGKKTGSPQLVKNILSEHHGPVCIERVGAMPGQGVSSMLNFARATASCWALLLDSICRLSKSHRLPTKSLKVP